jgi:hypothetical protein
MAEERTDKIKWHPAFYGAAELEFIENKNDLEFNREYNLSKEPIRMDLLIIKKLSGAKIKNEIGHIFKKYNVVEYKSPDDGLTIDDFFKTIGYACLYKGLGDNVDVVSAEELTVTIVREYKPTEMFEALKRLGGIIEKKSNGIYYVKGITILATQVVVTNELDQKSHSCLRMLSKKLQEDDARIFLKRTEKLDAPGDKNNIDAVLTVSVQANSGVFQKLKEEFNMSEVLKDFFKDEIDTMVDEKIQDKIQDKTVELTEALMDSMNISVEEAMENLKIPSSERNELKQKIECTLS